MTDKELIAKMHLHVNSAMGLYYRGEGFGDILMMEAEDIAKRLEKLGYTVSDGWTVRNHNGEVVSYA